MAVMQCTMLSSSLGRRINYWVIVPTMEFMDMFNPNYDYGSIKNLKTLYLLHGIGDNGGEWIKNTRIQLLADEKKLAVVMVDGENSFYTDLPNGAKYSAFVGKEIVEATRALFPLSHKREDTFISGLSMGGYGAIKTGLTFCETFGYMASMSGVLDICENIDNTPEEANSPLSGRAYMESIFGDLTKVKGSHHDLFALLENKLRKGAEIPKMYQACGTEDFLYENNQRYRKFAISNGIDFTYEEGTGGHDWQFWDTYIKKIVEWLPV